MGGEIIDIVIDELREGTFLAKIRFARDGRECYLDARPSDAVALAVRVGAEILVSPSVLEEAGIPVEDESEEPNDRSDDAILPTQAERLERALKKAVEQEHYEEAARLRDALQKLKEQQN